MWPFVTSGAMLRCSMGVAPAPLVVPDPIAVATTPIATEVDTIPIANIPPFGMCMSLGNPEVAAATAAAEGVLTPQPCMPATGAPWIPGALTVQAGGLPCVPITSMCECDWGGVITVIAPDQVLASGT
jgi:Domain of unknown function (DUF4280)